ncbi:MAG: BA14K family protein [Hyphomicrobium sp.]|nr:BA14K family protein [Hyphomicrobium sp.]
MRLPLAVTSVMVAIALLAVPATAAPLTGAFSKDLVAQSQAGDDSQVLQVQYRRGYRDGYRHRDRGDDGAGVAAGVLGGLMLGAIIANQAQQGRSVDYCMRRFRSYDPSSGTYLGNDGYRHRCP